MWERNESNVKVLIAIPIDCVQYDLIEIPRYEIESVWHYVDIQRESQLIDVTRKLKLLADNCQFSA